MMLLFETLAAASGIMTPYALSRIIKAVTGAREQSMSMVDTLTAPLLLFVGLALAEVVFRRIVGAIQIRTGPHLRQGVVRSLYHYLQHHSHRYMSSNFAGALAHRVSETAMGTLQILWIIATEFWPIVISIVVATALLFHAHSELGLFSLVWALAFIACSLLDGAQQPALRTQERRRAQRNHWDDRGFGHQHIQRTPFARLGFRAPAPRQEAGKGIQGHPHFIQLRRAHPLVPVYSGRRAQDRHALFLAAAVGQRADLGRRVRDGGKPVAAGDQRGLQPRAPLSRILRLRRQRLQRRADHRPRS